MLESIPRSCGKKQREKEQQKKYYASDNQLNMEVSKLKV